MIPANKTIGTLQVLGFLNSKHIVRDLILKRFITTTKFYTTSKSKILFEMVWKKTI